MIAHVYVILHSPGEREGLQYKMANFESGNGNHALSPTSISMTDDSPLVSLFRRGSDSWASWSRLGEQNRYSQLHSKFWGKKIEEEARQWRTSHPNVMDDEDEDIGPGCYALNLDDVDDEFLPKLWVRNDYIRIYEYCSERANATILGLRNARSVVITGQPGVGVFLPSVASHSLSNNPSHEKVKLFGSFTPSVVV